MGEAKRRKLLNPLYSAWPSGHHGCPDDFGHYLNFIAEGQPFQVVLEFDEFTYEIAPEQNSLYFTSIFRPGPSETYQFVGSFSLPRVTPRLAASLVLHLDQGIAAEVRPMPERVFRDPYGNKVMPLQIDDISTLRFWMGGQLSWYSDNELRPTDDAWWPVDYRVRWGGRTFTWEGWDESA